MGRYFHQWIWQAILFTILTLMVFLVLKYFQLTVGTVALWVSGVAIYWVLSGLVILPWNIYFAADDALEEIRQTQEKGGKINDYDKEYATATKKKARFWAILLHIFTALVFFILAIFTQYGTICYVAAGAALGLTGLRPAIRTMEHMLARLSHIQDKARFPRDDVYELKQRVAKMEYYDTVAKQLDESFDKKSKELTGLFDSKCEAMQEAVDKQAARIRELEQLILHVQGNISNKIDSFNDAVAFKTAWERVAPELAKLFRGTHP